MSNGLDDIKLESPFKGRVRSKALALIDGYKKDNNISIHQYLKDTFKILGGGDRYGLYLNTLSDKWLKGVPDKFVKQETNSDGDTVDVPMSEKEVRHMYDHKIMPFMLYCLSIFEIDRYFRTCEKVAGWLPLYIGDDFVYFIDKMFDVLPYKKLVSTRLRKIQPIFTQFMVMGESIARNTDDAKTQSDIAGSIITTATVAGTIKTPDIFRISKR